jgi:hypothetical protein
VDLLLEFILGVVLVVVLRVLGFVLKLFIFNTWEGGAGLVGYREWNFAPSGDWAAYDFTAHREGRTDADVGAPYLRVEDNMTWWALGATIPVEAGRQWELGLSAILEERDGTKSYWALAHPEGDKPDFHDPSCFTAHLP